MKTITNIAIYIITFTCGAIFLALEIVSSRVLAPYFGNSVYVWGSLISVFLLALSIGYFLGGKIADAYPSFKILGLIILLAGCYIAIVPVVYLPVSEWIDGLNLEFRFSILLASIVLFLIPSVLMGIVSPFIIKLVTKRLEEIGRSAGNIYSISTFGSIFGALTVTFYLIPLIGTRAILLILSGLLFFFSIICFLLYFLSEKSQNVINLSARN